jgi:hypothetical protein
VFGRKENARNGVTSRAVIDKMKTRVVRARFGACEERVSCFQGQAFGPSQWLDESGKNTRVNILLLLLIWY